jgi:hypothetical protein
MLLTGRYAGKARFERGGPLSLWGAMGVPGTWRLYLEQPGREALNG